MPAHVTIVIDHDKKCTECGQPGATESGLCLGCVADTIKVNPFLKGLYKISPAITKLITEYQKDLEEAWANVGESEVLSIAFSVKMGLDKGKGVSEIGISFIKEKIKGSCQVEWDPKQMNLIKK